MRKKNYRPWYATVGLKHVTGFVSPEDKAKLKKLAKDADKSLTGYVSALLRQHLRTLGIVHKNCPLLCSPKIDER